MSYIIQCILLLILGLVLGAMLGFWLARRQGAGGQVALREAFQAVSADALAQNNEQFLQLAQTRFATLQTAGKSELEASKKSIETLVQPLKENLEKFQQHNRELEQTRQQAYVSISEQVKHVVAGTEKLGSETNRLVTALRAPQARGRWGEIQLRRVVEMAGMLAHCDFYEQASAAGEDGRLRPDLVVKLPGGKKVVIDAKTPMQAYLEAIETEDEVEREQLLKDHARQTRGHLGKLSAKSYWQQFQPAPEFVVMFLPGEAYFSAALQADPSLIEEGVEQGVIPATPTTLIALLRAVSYGWQQERIAESAEAISKLGQDLYGRLATMAEHFSKVGSNLDRATKSYNDTVGSLERNVLPAARKFKEMGVSSDKKLEQIEPATGTSREIQAKELLPSLERVD